MNHQKTGGRFNQTFLQRRHEDGQETHNKMLDVNNHYIYLSQNYNELSPHTIQDSHHKKKKNLQTIIAEENVE